MNIGYIGLGNMGGALARRLQQTHPLSVFDLNAAAVARMVQDGARACATLRELAQSCDVILMCLPTSAHVRAAIFGPEGLAAGLRRGTLLVDQTTGEPHATKAMAAELAPSGVTLIDAPVSGGATGAAAGTIAIMIGATTEDYQRAEPVLRAISSNLFHAGGVGAGQVMKLVNNHLSGAQRLLSMEALALAVKNGIDPARACEILVSGGARNAFLEKQAPPIIKGNLDVGFTLALMHKDLRQACDLGSASGVPLLFGNLAREFYQMCISERGGDAQVQTAALVMDRLAGTHVVPATVKPKQD